MTIDALRSTLAANVQGLRVAPPGPAIAAEAAALRASGAEVVIVAAHAGGRCDRFDDPDDLTSCDDDSEIFQVARSLPHGLVDVIAAGHTHSALAHRVNGIAIIQPLSRGQAFGRADVMFDPRTRTVARTRLFAPQDLCRHQDGTSGSCGPATEWYEGRRVESDRAVEDAMLPALARVRRLQATTLGRSLNAPIHRGSDLGSPLGDIFADALRDAVPGSDVAVVNTATRGLWADLPDGAADVRTALRCVPVRQSHRASDDERRRSARLGGQRDSAGPQERDGHFRRTTCESIVRRRDARRFLRDDGRAIEDNYRLVVVTIAAPTLSGNVVTAAPPGGIGPTDKAPIVREVVEEWFREPDICCRIKTAARAPEWSSRTRRRRVATRPLRVSRPALEPIAGERPCCPNLRADSSLLHVLGFEASELSQQGNGRWFGNRQLRQGWLCPSRRRAG